MKSDQEERHIRDIALVRASQTLVGIADPDAIVKGAEAYLAFLRGDKTEDAAASTGEISRPLASAHHIWFMERSPEEMTALIGSYMTDRPEFARDIAFYLLKNWLHAKGAPADE